MKLVRNDIKISELKETLDKETGLADDGKQGENKRRIAKHKQVKGKICAHRRWSSKKQRVL